VKSGNGGVGGGSAGKFVEVGGEDGLAEDADELANVSRFELLSDVAIDLRKRKKVSLSSSRKR
jgi:hypothetical protein